MQKRNNSNNSSNPNSLKNQNDEISKTLVELTNEVRRQNTDQPLHGDMSYIDAYSTLNRIINSSLDEMTNEDDTIQPSSSQKKRLPGGKIPQSIIDLVQQANTEYIQGDFEKARNILLQVIRKRPNYAYSYSVLASIAESNGNLEQSLQFRTIAALIENKYDAWEEVLHLAERLNKINIQIYSLKRMSRMKHNEDLVLSNLAKIYINEGYKLKAFKALERLVSLKSSDERAVESFVNLAMEFNKLEDADKAITVYMQTKNITDWSPLIFNQKCEILNQHELYDQTIILIRDYADAHNIELQDLPPELIFHYGKANLNSHLLSEAETAFKYIQDLPVDQVYDIMSDIGVAYKNQEKYYEAIEIFKQIEDISQIRINVYYELGICHEMVDKIEDAIYYYQKYLNEKENDASVRGRLLSLLQRIGDTGRAESLIDSRTMLKPESEEIQRTARHGRSKHKISQRTYHEILLAVQQAEFYEDQNNIEEFINQLAPIYRACANRNSRNKRESEYLTEKQKRNISDLKEVDHILLAGRIWEWDDIIVALGEEPALNLVLRLASSYVNNNQEDRGFFMLETMLKGVISKEYLGNFKTFLIKLYIKVGKYKQAYRHLRYAISKDVYNEIYWGLIYVFLQKGMNHASTFMMVLLNKHPDCAPALMVLGHCSMHSGVDVLALGYYLAALKNNSKNALLNLCIGSVFLNSISRKSTSEKHQIVLNAFSFLYQYADNSKEYPIEVYYNLGRAYHQINLNTQAVYYYKKVLAYADNPTIPEDNLIQEAAINLSRLYFDNNNEELAISILSQYVVI